MAEEMSLASSSCYRGTQAWGGVAAAGFGDGDACTVEDTTFHVVDVGSVACDHCRLGAR